MPRDGTAWRSSPLVGGYLALVHVRSLMGAATDAREASGLCGRVAGQFRKGVL